MTNLKWFIIFTDNLNYKMLIKKDHYNVNDVLHKTTISVSKYFKNQYSHHKHKVYF